MRLAWYYVSTWKKAWLDCSAYIFDVWAWVNSDDIAMLDAEVVADNTVDSRTSIIEIIICKDDQDCVFSLLSFDQDCVSSEKL